jgi:hypothetical protein
MSKEIKAKIDQLHLDLEQVVTPGMFTLNMETAQISNKIAALQNQCQHHFVDGQCEFCYRMEGDNNE